VILPQSKGDIFVTVHNALAHVNPTTIRSFRAAGRDVEFAEIGIDHLGELMRRFPVFEKKLNGEEVHVDTAEWKELCAVGIAMALAPDATPAERAEIEESARGMKRMEREIAFITVFKASFPEYDEAFTESEAAMGTRLATKAAPANRTARRATRSRSTAKKPRS